MTKAVSRGKFVLFTQRTIIVRTWALFAEMIKMCFVLKNGRLRYIADFQQLSVDILPFCLP